MYLWSECDYVVGGGTNWTLPACLFYHELWVWKQHSSVVHSLLPSPSVSHWRGLVWSQCRACKHLSRSLRKRAHLQKRPGKPKWWAGLAAFCWGGHQWSLSWKRILGRKSETHSLITVYETFTDRGSEQLGSAMCRQDTRQADLIHHCAYLTLFML